MSLAEVVVGKGLRADEGVHIGYPSPRATAARAVIGDGARLRSGTVLYQGIRVGDRFETGHHVIVREETTIGDDVSIWSNSVIDYGCSIGSRVKIHSNCYVAQFSEIHDAAFLAPGVTLANDLYPGFAESARLMRGPTIEAGAQIGVNATVLPYVTVGRGALVGAGAVVTRDVPPHSVAYGCPAVTVGEVEDLADVRRRVELLAQSSERRRAQARGGAHPHRSLHVRD
jgi:acetyltransferase-like isoleucine patch superfamily enzyme